MFKTSRAGWCGDHIILLLLLCSKHLEQGGDPGGGEHQEGGAHQHQLQRPDVGNLQPADSPR